MLDYHHVPVKLKLKIKDHYDNYAISIGTYNYSTEPIFVRKGVLQDDCLSQSLFNMVTNTLIKTFNEKKVKCLEYNYCDIISPYHWSQFAEYFALVSYLLRCSPGIC